MKQLMGTASKFVCNRLASWRTAMGTVGRALQTPIGVDIGMRRIKAVQFGRSAGVWQIHAATSLPRAGTEWHIDAEEVRQLRSQLIERGFRGNAIVLAMPADRLLTRARCLVPTERKHGFYRIRFQVSGPLPPQGTFHFGQVPSDGFGRLTNCQFNVATVCIGAA